jgi:hypothetical protein
MMALKQWLIGMAGALALTTMVGQAQSAPLAGAVSHFKSAGRLATQVAAYRLCTADGGVRRCRWVNLYGPRAYGYQAPTSTIPLTVTIPVPVYRYRPASQYTPTLPNDVPFGTSRWWVNMDRQRTGAF